MEIIGQAAGDPAPDFLRLPVVGTLFRSRALRFGQLAERHVALAGYLRLMARLAGIQQRLAEPHSTFPLPEPAATRCRDPAWRDILRRIVRSFGSCEGVLAATFERLSATTDDDLEVWADRLLASDCEALDPAVAPFLAAALQVFWTRIAAGIDPGPGDRPEPAIRCPVCGSLPVASVVQSGGALQGLRYLCCSLCAAEWRRTRIHCVLCGSSRGVAYFGIEGTGGAVKAEACSDCKSYLKVMNREKDPAVDPFADDMATLGLDILLADRGYQRLGFNPLLIPGK